MPSSLSRPPSPPCVRRAAAALAALAALTLTPAAAAQPPDPSAAAAQAMADREALAAASLAFSQALVAGDMEALGRLYSEDAVLLPPGRELVGREAARRWFAPRPGRRQVEHSMVASEVLVWGDVATDHGTWRSTVQRGEEPWSSSTGKYLIVWVREADGAWRIRYDAWNVAAEEPEALPAASPPPLGERPDAVH